MSKWLDSKSYGRAMSSMKVKGKNLNIAFPDFNFVALQYLNKILKPPQSKALTFSYRMPILYYCFHQRHVKMKAMKSFIHITNGNQHWIENGFGFSKKTIQNGAFL